MRLIYHCPKCGNSYLFEKWLDVTREFTGSTADNFSIYYCPWCAEPTSYDDLASEWEKQSV